MEQNVSGCFFLNTVYIMLSVLYATARLSLSVCHMVGSVKTVGVEIMHFYRTVAPSIQVFADVSSWNSGGFPQIGASNKGGVRKQALCVNISKMVGDTSLVTIIE